MGLRTACRESGFLPKNCVKQRCQLLVKWVLLTNKIVVLGATYGIRRAADTHRINFLSTFLKHYWHSMKLYFQKNWFKIAIRLTSYLNFFSLSFFADVQLCIPTQRVSTITRNNIAINNHVYKSIVWYL